jgi:hypothetical protein
MKSARFVEVGNVCASLRQLQPEAAERLDLLQHDTRPIG